MKTWILDKMIIQVRDVNMKKLYSWKSGTRLINITVYCFDNIFIYMLYQYLHVFKRYNSVKGRRCIFFLRIIIITYVIKAINRLIVLRHSMNIQIFKDWIPHRRNFCTNVYKHITNFWQSSFFGNVIFGEKHNDPFYEWSDIKITFCFIWCYHKCKCVTIFLLCFYNM